MVENDNKMIETCRFTYPVGARDEIVTILKEAKEEKRKR